jgi:hypothetical protein
MISPLLFQRVKIIPFTLSSRGNNLETLRRLPGFFHGALFLLSGIFLLFGIKDIPVHPSADTEHDCFHFSALPFLQR